MPAFSIGKFKFPSKTAAQAACRSLLYAADVGCILSGDALELAKEILRAHTHSEEKLRGGLKAVRIRRNKIPGQKVQQRTLYVVHDDNSETEFSAYNPLWAAGSRRDTGIKTAARLVIEPERLACKNAAFNSPPVFCAATNVELTWETAHVDHDAPWPFRKILAAWLETLPEPPVLIDRKVYWEMQPEDAASFRAFHNARARLRVIHIKENIADRHNRVQSPATPSAEPVYIGFGDVPQK